jgi:hypothetical protein
MGRDGPVIIIHNDSNSQKLLVEVFDKLEYSNELVFFNDVDVALEYIEKSKKTPFLILIEVNPQSTDKYLVKIKLQRNYALQMVPHIFFSRTFDQKIIAHASNLNNQGFFIVKNVDDTVELIIVIIEYWKRNVSPFDYSY